MKSVTVEAWVRALGGEPTKLVSGAKYGRYTHSLLSLTHIFILGVFVRYLFKVKR